MLLPYLLLPNILNIQDMIMGGRNHALEKISRGSGSSKRGEQSFRNSCPVNKGRLMWSYWRMNNFWLNPNNREVMRLTQLGSLGTLVMSASSSTPTITVGNSHFFTGQKKSLKHPSMLRQQKPLRHFQACSLKQKHLLQHTSMQTLFQTFHTRCMRVQRGSIYPKFVQACQETYCSSQQKL